MSARTDRAIAGKVFRLQKEQGGVPNQIRASARRILEGQYGQEDVDAIRNFLNITKTAKRGRKGGRKGNLGMLMNVSRDIQLLQDIEERGGSTAVAVTRIALNFKRYADDLIRKPGTIKNISNAVTKSLFGISALKFTGAVGIGLALGSQVASFISDIGKEIRQNAANIQGYRRERSVEGRPVTKEEMRYGHAMRRAQRTKLLPVELTYLWDRLYEHFVPGSLEEAARKNIQERQEFAVKIGTLAVNPSKVIATMSQETGLRPEQLNPADIINRMEQESLKKADEVYKSKEFKNKLDRTIREKEEFAIEAQSEHPLWYTIGGIGKPGGSALNDPNFMRQMNLKYRDEIVLELTKATEDTRKKSIAEAYKIRSSRSASENAINNENMEKRDKEYAAHRSRHQMWQTD